MPIRPEMRDKYHPDWSSISRRIRHERADGRCECQGECGHDHAKEWDDHQKAFEAAWGCSDLTDQSDRCLAINHGPHPITESMVVLTVAHLDHDPTNNDDDNLRAMCQRCHLAYDKEHHKQTRRKRLAVRDLFEPEEIL